MALWQNFDIAIQILDADSRIRPGMSATGRIAVEKIADGIIVPPDAGFEKNGGSVAYVLHGSQFEEFGTSSTAQQGRAVDWKRIAGR